MKKLEKEINALSKILPYLELSKKSNIRIEKAIEKDTKLLESIRKLSKNIIFPDVDLYTKLYYKQAYYFRLAVNVHAFKTNNDEHIEIIKLFNFFEDIKDCNIESVTFKAENGKTIKLKSRIVRNTIFALTKKTYTNPIFSEIAKMDFVKKNRIKKNGYNKLYIQCHQPLFAHLKTHNPDLSNNEIYTFLKKFMIKMRFDFESAYPCSVEEDEPFKSYFSELK